MRTISVLIICQDEEKYIYNCLSWIFKYVNPDEYVIVDGGSKDKTIEIIQTFSKDFKINLKLIENPMPDSFSEQRNLALENCTGNWILIINADETYSKNISVLIEFIRNHSFDGILGFIFPTAHLVEDEFHMANSGGDIHLRLFKNLTNMGFVGDVHEDLYYKGLCIRLNRKKLGTITLRNIALRHYSLLGSDEELLKKGKRFMRWTKQSTIVGIPIKDKNWFINDKHKYSEKKNFKVPEEWE